MPLNPSLPFPWKTHEDYHAKDIHFLDLPKFETITNLLLERPNLNSTHLFRADILWDSANILETVEAKAQKCNRTALNGTTEKARVDSALPHPEVPGFSVRRTIVRRLIPRKPQLDKPLEQTCHIYSDHEDVRPKRLVLYLPHAATAEAIPWYHPPLRGIAYLYIGGNNPSLSIYFLPFNEAELPQRTHRTLLSLLSTFIRLAKLPDQPQDLPLEHSLANLSIAPSAIKDTIIPQHAVQNTYTDLKQRYASDTISRWVESTEPSKHVFEDLSIAAFLICLFHQMYPPDAFPGFVDIACGNGILVYILLKEGFQGYGFDARRRKTWEILDIDGHLSEKICIPRPFLDIYPEDFNDIEIHDGVFPPGTFIISNHADEITPWTPLLAALSCLTSPLPFLAIPCCSHALSGAKHRYTLRDLGDLRPPSETPPTEDDDSQSSSGDLKALRKARQQAATHQDNKSMYACLTKKVVGLAWELGIETELTLMRIPSTRNIGIVGGRVEAMKTAQGGNDGGREGDGSEMWERVKALIEKECAMSGGVESAARIWAEGARRLQGGQGRGKLNLRGKIGDGKSNAKDAGQMNGSGTEQLHESAEDG